MAALDTAMVAAHLVFAGLWAGSVIFVTVGVLPLARDGEINARPMEALVDRLTTISRVSAVVLLGSGGYLAGTSYTGASLVGTTGGRLVLAMVVLWLVLAALVEIGSGRLADGFTRGKVRTPAHNSIRLYQAASLVAVALLVVGGLLAAA